MEEIAGLAGITKRTLYNNYADKEALFIEVVGDVTAYADAFVAGLRDEFSTDITSTTKLRASLDDLGVRLALGIVRPKVIAIRRLLIGEARAFPTLAREYFDRAPGQVIEALAEWFALLDAAGMLRVGDARSAAAQFAYLVAGEHLDRAMLVGITPPRQQVMAAAREGVATFLARYGTTRGGRGRSR
jgi:TetR/AcrR family transcriptional repressor of mexJK operon